MITPRAPHRSAARTARGFTLLEVIVALAIVAFGLTALFTTVNQSARAADFLREKTLGGWIALNRITEARLAGDPPGEDAVSGTLEYAGEHWRWELKAVKTPVEGIVRLEARAAPETAPETVWPGFAVGFMGSAVAPPRVVSPYAAAEPPRDTP